MKADKIWFVSEVFYPDETSTGYIMTRIAKEIAEHSEVHVICGPAGYDEIHRSDDTIAGKVHIHRIQWFNWNKNNLFLRISRAILLSLGIFFKALFATGKGEKIFMVTNPPFLIPMIAVLSKWKGNPLIILVHDVFPENLVSTGIIQGNNPVYSFLKAIFNWSFRQSETLVVLGEDMHEIMRSKTSANHPVVIIENWGDTEKIIPETFEGNDLVREYGLENKLVFTFAGNLGRVQGLGFFFEVIKEIANPDIHFLFVGNGAMLDELKSFSDKENIQSVTFAGTKPRSEQVVFLNAAHFGIVTLSSALYGLGVPSKSYNILAAGKPILFIGDLNSEIAKMIDRHQCGYAFNESGRDDLLKFFNDFRKEDLQAVNKMGIKARELAVSLYSENAILKKFRDLLI